MRELRGTALAAAEYACIGQVTDDTLTTQYGITPSMSRRANPYDNAMAENFFSILKSECIRLYKPVIILQA